MNIKSEEQETTINLSRDNNSALVWTSDRTIMTKLDRMCQRNPDTYKCTKVGKFMDGSLADKEYSFPKRLLSFRSGKKKDDTE